MELILDTANVEQIKAGIEWYNITGVTTNPTILSKEKEDVKKILGNIKDIIGERQLHVQVVGNTWEEMVEEAIAITNAFGKNTYIKIPSNHQGYRAMKELVQKEIHVTATVVYSPEQAMMDAFAGVDYVAVYYNKQYNVNINPAKTTEEIHKMFEDNHVKTKILTASFRNPRQVIESFLNGADAVTVPYHILELFSQNPLVEAAVNGFENDWQNVFKGKKLYELV